MGREGERSNASSGRDSERASDPPRLPRAGGEDLLLAAQDVVGRGLGPSGQEPWSPERFQIELPKQVDRLRQWADENDLWLETELLGEFRHGRREHHLYRHDDLLDWVFKITHGAGYGFVPTFLEHKGSMIDEWFGIFPATPFEYFERLILSNEINPGMNALEGFCEIEGRFTIITSQPFIAGQNSTRAEQIRFLKNGGFTELCESIWFRPEDGLALFDVGSSNILTDESGYQVPIDIVPIRPPGNSVFYNRLHEAFLRKVK